ncbi:MAG TPA: hypothetical protein PKJ17_09490 [Syntrophorhabdaceae bacterium]|nr:hypothetical protein [Syntrophorhabdaceae bacterium]
MAATRDDMRKLISGNGAPFSKYLVKVAGKGYLVIPGTVDQGNISIRPQGDNLLVTLPFDLAKEAGLVTNADIVPVAGGWCFGGKVAVMPGLYSPVVCTPTWLPAGVSVSVDSNGKLEFGLAKKFKSETERLVSYMEMTKLLEGASGEVMGYFSTVPQLKKLLDRMGQDARSDPGLSVLNATGADPFALVIVRRGR